MYLSPKSRKIDKILNVRNQGDQTGAEKPNKNRPKCYSDEHLAKTSYPIQPGAAIGILRLFRFPATEHKQVCDNRCQYHECFKAHSPVRAPRLCHLVWIKGVNTTE